MPRFLHLPAPVRVAFPGCPVPRSLSPEPASESSGCPLVSVLRLCRRWMFELPRTSHAFGGAGFSGAPSFPGGSHFLLQRPRCRTSSFLVVLHLRLYRRWIIESPRCSHLSAVPSCQSSSRPEYQPFGIADDSSSRLPRTSNPPAPTDGYPSYPGSRTYPVCLG